MAKPRKKKIMKKKAVKRIRRAKVLIKKKVKKARKAVKKVKKIRRIKRKIARKPKRKTVSRRVAKKIVKRRKVSKRKKLVSLKVKKAVHHKPQKILIKKTKITPPASSVKISPAHSLFKAKIRVVGIGGGGGSIVSELSRSLKKASFVVADTDVRALRKNSSVKNLWFGQELTHGLGTGVNIDLAKQAAESAREKIKEIFEGQDIVIFIACLGGGLGSGATQIFVEAAREFGGISLGIFTMPFKFEGKNKHRIAQNALKSLRKSLNVSLVIPNERIFRIINEATPILTAFSTVNKSLIESLESLIDLIYNPGIINIDFADLRTILRGNGNSAFLNTVEESGKDKVDKICEKIFKNPLLQTGGFKAEKILFNISGSEALSMFQVEKISSHIANINPKAKIIFGISKDSKLKNKIKTTILMTGGASEAQDREPAVEKIIPKKKTPTSKPPRSFASKKKNKGVKKNPAERKEEKKSISFLPVFEVPTPVKNPSIPVLDQRRAEVVRAASSEQKIYAKKTIRRSGLEVKKAEELQEKKRLAQEKEWEIPAFLRRVRFKS